MAARINQSIQNTLWLLNPLHHPLSHKVKPRFHFRRNPLFLSSSSAKRALSCTCTSASTVQDGGEPFVLTTPLYYVNAPPHMGSAYTTIAADAVARFQWLLGKKVVFITGTDEHGEKIATAAAAAQGSNPSEHCDVFHKCIRVSGKIYISALSQDKGQSNLQSAVSQLKEIHSRTPEKLVEKTRVHYEKLSLSSACEAILEICNAGNSYMDEHAPWSLFKQGGSASEAAAKDLVIILEALRIIAIALSPVTPSLCWRIYGQLGFPKDQFDTVTWGETKWGVLKGGQIMAQPKPVFARIENRMEDEDGGGPAKKEARSKDRVPQAQGVAEA